MGGGHGACANPIFYAETAGTAQGVDVALPYGGGGGGGAWSVCKPNFLCRNRWNSARSWCSFALRGGLGGGMERVQTQFLICRTGGCSFGSVGLIFAHVARFWDVGPALAPYWAMLSHFSGILWFLLAFVGQELGPHWACLGPFWAMLGHFGPCWTRVGTILGLSWAILGYVGTFWAMLEPWLILGHFVLFSDLSRPLFWTRAFQRRWLFVHARVCKKHQKYQEKYNLWTTLLMVFAAIFWLFLFLFWGCSHVGPFWAIFGSVSAFVLDSGMSASLTFRPCKACAKKNKNTRKKMQFVSPSGFPLLNAMT